MLFFRASSRVRTTCNLTVAIAVLVAALLLFACLSGVHEGRTLTIPFLTFFVLLRFTFFFSDLAGFVRNNCIAIVLTTLVFTIVCI